MLLMLSPHEPGSLMLGPAKSPALARRGARGLELDISGEESKYAVGLGIGVFEICGKWMCEELPVAGRG